MAAKRFAKVDRARCVSCGACQNECPREAITVWRGCFAVVDLEKCIGCGICQKTCPADCIEMMMREGERK